MFVFVEGIKPQGAFFFKGWATSPGHLWTKQPVSRCVEVVQFGMAMIQAGWINFRVSHRWWSLDTFFNKTKKTSKDISKVFHKKKGDKNHLWDHFFEVTSLWSGYMWIHLDLGFPGFQWLCYCACSLLGKKPSPTKATAEWAESRGVKVRRWPCWVNGENLEYLSTVWYYFIPSGEVAKLEACSVISPLFFEFKTYCKRDATVFWIHQCTRLYGSLTSLTVKDSP